MCLFDFDKDFVFGNGMEGFDDGEFDFQGGGLVEEVYDGLYYFGDGLFELVMFFGEDKGLFVEEGLVIGIFVEGNDGDEDLGCGGEIGCLMGLFFKNRQFFDSILEICLFFCGVVSENIM